MGPIRALLVLLIAPASLNLATAQPPGSVGHHGNVQAGSNSPPLLRLAEQSGQPVSTGVEDNGNDLKAVDPNILPAKSQHMSIDRDGQYSFGYSAASSARQERRHSDGTVQGSYSYQDPNGKTVEISYTADANGFNAYGENLPPRQVVFAPYPVQDTPEVAEARAKFLEYYQREYNHRKSLEAKENATKEAALATSAAQPPSPSIPIAKDPDMAEVIVSSDDTGDAESEIVQASDAVEDSAPQRTGESVSSPQSEQAAVPQAPGTNLYNVQFTVGGQQASAGSPITRSSVTGPGYFYYVGVGGLPHYVTTATRSNAPVSLRASQIGAIPAAAIHDAQTPHYGGSVLKTKPFPPVYVEVGQDYSQGEKMSGNNVAFQNFGGNNLNQNAGLVIPSYPLYFPFQGFRVNKYQK